MPNESIKGLGDGGRDRGGEQNGSGNMGASVVIDEAIGKDLGVADMWMCPQCQQNSFLSRRFCFFCRNPRPVRPRVKSEVWPRRLLGVGGTRAEEASDLWQGGRATGEQRIPLLRWGGNTAGARLQRAKGGKGGEGSKKAWHVQPQTLFSDYFHDSM